MREDVSVTSGDVRQTMTDLHASDVTSTRITVDIPICRLASRGSKQTQINLFISYIIKSDHAIYYIPDMGFLLFCSEIVLES